MRFRAAFGCSFGSGSRILRLLRFARHRLVRETAFSVIELLIVVAIIGTLAAIAVPSLFAAIDQARITKAVGDIHAIELDIKAFVLTKGRMPVDLSEVGADQIIDPWGHPYVYTDLTAIKGKGKARKDRFLNPLNSDFDLYSVGPDGKSSTPLTAQASRDDIVRANDGAFIGPASEF